MGMTFKERLALAASAGSVVAPTQEIKDVNLPSLQIESEKKEVQTESPLPTKTSRFGAPRPQIVASAGGDSTKPLTQASLGVHNDAFVLAVAEDEQVAKLTLGEVIAAHNTIANKPPEKLASNQEAEALSGTDAPSIVKELQQRISQLSQLEGIDLKHEMGMLKEMITVNGDACRYLMPEDLGLMVRGLRRMTDNKVAQDMSRARPTKSKAVAAPTAKEIAGLLDELDLSL